MYRQTNVLKDWAQTCGPDSDQKCATEQSSVDGNQESSLAVDGLGIPTSSSCSSTLRDLQNWWSLDLGRTIAISGVRIQESMDMGKELDGFSIYIGNYNSEIDRFTKNSICVPQTEPKLVNGIYEITCTTTISGQYMFTVSTNNKSITLCEVSVWSSVCKLCPENSQSFKGSIALTDCKCMSGYAGENGDNCVMCDIDTFREKDFIDMLATDKPYIVSDAVDWNQTSGSFNSLCNKQTCAGNTGSVVQGLVSTGTIAGRSNVFDNSPSLTVLALLPNATGSPMFTSQSTRNGSSLGSTIRPIYNKTRGPAGNSEVLIDRTRFQFMDAGPLSLNIATNGGFTVVAVVKFTGIMGTGEVVLDFAKAWASDNTIIARSGLTSSLYFSIRNAGTECYVTTALLILPQDTWLNITATYVATNRTITLKIGDYLISKMCLLHMADRTVVNTFVGKSFLSTYSFLNGAIAGLFVVDAYMKNAETDAVLQRIYAGSDLLREDNPFSIKRELLLGTGLRMLCSL